MHRLVFGGFGRHLLALLALLLMLAPAAAQTPMVTPSATLGQLLVFTAALDVDFLDVERGGIFLMRPDGSNIRQLTSFQTINYSFEQHGLNLPDDHPAISPTTTGIST
jgi:hypothetical protein